MRHWVDNRAPEVVALNIVCLFSVFVTFAVRLYAQSLVTNPWKALDTWFALVASVFAAGVAGCILYAVKLGLGKHTRRIVLEDLSPPDNLADIFKYGYIQSILQAVCIMFTKLAILALYTRVFGLLHHDRCFTYGVYVCTVFSVLLGIGEISVFILQCVPPQVFWNRIYLLFPVGHPKGPVEGYCMDQVTHVVVPIALDLVSEVAIMLLPARILWNLCLPWKKKIGLGVTFSLGIFVSVTNIVRISIYARMVNGGDIAWDDIDAFIWTIVQMSFAVVCASIPPCAPLLKVFSKRKGGSSRGYGSSLPLSDLSNPQSSHRTKGQDKISFHRMFNVSYNDRKTGDGESIQELNGIYRSV
ncbi:uncharacterized protein BDR25DRAFT_288451 [Lindgomyces ingoldianus]|uniref:Uncharacterized protein n=1 Tax=Lindgomyces ingoldianus TaxID=673940 RepID=A0ACB6QRN1_9PLEO|nr:uncharacterized protein BDR25DRAFT_288451 [Lindgomyces ingoldianus]KAF2469545.1 hypothetical protein BDR25DRAFT_288451 [Lindgomyces ingoldianus]